jgi:hypothetical protein
MAAPDLVTGVKPFAGIVSAADNPVRGVKRKPAGRLRSELTSESMCLGSLLYEHHVAAFVPSHRGGNGVTDCINRTT